MDSIPVQGVFKALRSTQPSIPLGWVNRVQALLAGVKAGGARLSRAASNIVSTILLWHPVVLRWLADEELYSFNFSMNDLENRSSQ